MRVFCFSYSFIELSFSPPLNNNYFILKRLFFIMILMYYPIYINFSKLLNKKWKI